MRSITSLAVGCLALVLGGAGCITVPAKVAKDPAKVIANVPNAVNDFLDADDIALFTAQGFKVYTGNTPPTINGKWNFNMKISYDPGTFDGAYPIGFILPDYVYYFKDQQNSEINAAYWSDEVGDISDYNDGYISGANDCFTVFINQTGEIEGCKYVSPQLISACKTSSGLKNVDMAYLVKSKDGDSCDRAAPVGYVRIASDPLADKSNATPPEELR